MGNIDGVHPKDWKVGTSYSLQGSFQLTDIKASGIDCIELVLSGSKEDLETDRFKKIFNQEVEKANELDLDIWSVHLPFASYWDLSTINQTARNEIIKHHYKWLEWVSAIGVKNVVVHPSFEPISDDERKDRMTACKDSLDQLAQKAKSLGIAICVENLPRTCLANTSDEMKELLIHESLGVCCDVNHALFEKPEQFINVIGRKIVTTHISDYDGIDEKHWIPKKGIINWVNVITSLVNAQYTGPFMFEVGGADDPRELMSCWNSLLDEYNETV